MDTRELFDELARLQTVGGQHTAARGHTPESLAHAVGHTLRNETDMSTARALVARVLAAEEYDDLPPADREELRQFIGS